MKVSRISGIKIHGIGRKLRLALDWTMDLFFARDYVQLSVHERKIKPSPKIQLKQTHDDSKKLPTTQIQVALNRWENEGGALINGR